MYMASTMWHSASNQPWMTGEYWAGWYDAWGGQHARTDADLQARNWTGCWAKGIQ